MFKSDLFVVSFQSEADGTYDLKILFDQLVEFISYILRDFDLAVFFDSIQLLGAIGAIALTAPAYEFLRRYFLRFEIINVTKIAPESVKTREWAVDILNKSNDLLQLTLLIYNDRYEWNKGFRVARRTTDQGCRHMKIRGNAVDIEGIFPGQTVKLKILTTQAQMLYFFESNKRVKAQLIEDYTEIRKIPKEMNKVYASISFFRLNLLLSYFGVGFGLIILKIVYLYFRNSQL